MMNIRDIFQNSEVAEKKCDENVNEAATDRKMYCPSCYKDYYTEKDKCPVCGCELQEPYTEEEEEELAEIFFATRT